MQRSQHTMRRQIVETMSLPQPALPQQRCSRCRLMCGALHGATPRQGPRSGVSGVQQWRSTLPVAVASASPHLQHSGGGVWARLGDATRRQGLGAEGPLFRTRWRLEFFWDSAS
jgi:hypothetical protein